MRVRGFDVDQLRAPGQVLQHRILRRVIEIHDFDQAAPGIDEETIVAVDGRGAVHEVPDIEQGGDFGLLVQALPAGKLSPAMAALIAAAQRADPLAQRGKVVHADVRADIDAVRLEQGRQFGLPHGGQIEVVLNGLAQIAGADPVVAGVVEPALPRQLQRQRGLAHAGHAQQRKGL